MKVEYRTEDLFKPLLGSALGHFNVRFAVESHEKFLTTTELLRATNLLDCHDRFLFLSHLMQFDCIQIADFTCMYVLQNVNLIYMVH